MKTLLAAAFCAFTLMGTGALAAPDETQKQLIQRTQEAKKKLAAAQAASGSERQKLMQEMTTQMQKAKPRAGMTPEQMREWMDEHLKLMDQLMGQMMSEHHMMMQGMGGMGSGGMMGGGTSKK